VIKSTKHQQILLKWVLYCPFSQFLVDFGTS